MTYCIRLSRRKLALALLLAAALATGCSPTQPFYFFEDGDLSHYVGVATNIEYPDVKTCSLQEVNDPMAPLTVSNPKFNEPWDLCLADAVKIALENGKVMRSLGVRVSSLQNIARTNIPPVPEGLTSAPSNAITVYEPALVESDPVFGIEGALSAFDAQLVSSMVWDKHDQPQNVSPFATNISSRVFQQDLGTFQNGITKTTATGAEVTAFANTTYNSNNNPTQQVPSAWSQNLELGIRQPLLQGAGSVYNRIAGPFDPLRGIGTFLQYDGVVIARIRTDIRLADFEAGVRNFVADIENAYWELYFAYRNLESNKSGRDAALQTWKEVHAKFIVGAKGGEADREAQSREQYFLFRASLETALSDVYKAENRLRYLMGLAATDGRLIRPSEEPTDAHVLFDWSEIHAEAMCRSVELRQEKWRIKQREMELIASKNLLLPRLDVGAKYRWLGLGQDLVQQPGVPYNPTDTSANPLGQSIKGTDAFSTLASGDFQEWELSLNFSMPIGFRQPLAAVRNAQLNLARERSILQDQELELSHQLADVIRDVDTDYVLARTNFNRFVAAQRQVEAVEAAYNAGTVTLDLLLEAQRTRADAESSYYRSLADYNKAVMFVHFRKGSLLEYNGIYLAEGPWPAKAYFDARRRARARDAGLYLDYGYTRPAVMGEGPYPQFQSTNGTSSSTGASPTEAHPEELSLPKPNEATPPVPPSKQETLPEPGPSPLPQASMGPRLMSAGGMPAVEKRMPPSAKAEPQRSTIRVSGAQSSTASAAKVDHEVQQASAETPFDWGNLSLDTPSKSPPAPATATSTPPSTGKWKSVSAANSDASSTGADDSSAAGWKRAQR
jgi:outer membrane protein TolC